MKSKMVVAALIVVVVIGFVSLIRLSDSGGKFYDDDSNEYEDSGFSGSDLGQSSSSGETSSSNSGNFGSLVSLSTLAKHNSRTDCWVAYGGKVYDITSWLPAHPGGSFRIEPYCGTSEEFTNAFTSQHGTSQVNRLMKVGVLIGDFDVKGSLA